MDAKTKTMLINLMKMTTSSFDGEALTAIRKANALLDADEVDWEQFLSCVKTQEKPKQQKRHQPNGRRPSNYFHDLINHTDADEINALLADAMRKIGPRSSYYEFMQDVIAFWEQRGYLTPKYYRAVRNIVGR